MVSRPAGERTGRVVAVAVGVVQVRSRGHSFRATVGSRLLGAMAGDPEAAPRVGDRVRLCFWPDGPVTVERVLARPVAGPDGPVGGSGEDAPH